MSKQIAYLIVPAHYEYDDEHYYKQGQEAPLYAYSKRVDAERRVAELVQKSISECSYFYADELFDHVEYHEVDMNDAENAFINEGYRDIDGSFTKEKYPNLYKILEHLVKESYEIVKMEIDK